MPPKAPINLKKSPHAKVLIDKERIQSSQTLDYLSKNELENSADLEAITPKCYSEDQHENFHKHSKTYELNCSIQKAWDAYITIPPEISWSGRRLIFSFAYDTSPKNISYAHDSYDGMKENQLIFIVIKIFFGLFKLAVTHYVSEVLPDQKKVKLCYVDGGKSWGSQFIRFEKISEDRTIIVHETYYRSDSKFRDEKLYPWLHERIIDQFHKNVKKYLASK